MIAIRRYAGPVLIGLAALLLAWAGWSYWQAGNSPEAESGHDRDLALSAGKQQIAALNSMDHARVDAGLRQWLNASTGPLHDQLRRDSAQSRQRILQARTSAEGSVTAAALTELDGRAGTAQVIASVEIRLTPQAGAPSVQRKRYEAGLSRTPGGWKLTSLTAIPAGAR
ncbi:hypothetical protein DPM19_32500 [Actinomadura craniellae]|uniref:SnoaL-like domain-containing protein n=1 Tax=Actinomadura craniellae TaxID=2231787 RepID=A0A365GW38_9ACTN|nr:hypothetical protein [Actinomadura craniellae]RAY11025.1 hypothetical protein DPM19_32500 [Actinomadura craniellae]